MALALAGCAAHPVASLTPVQPAAISGSVHGGQQPISGAAIALVAPGATGYGSAGSVIVSTTTDAGGNFTLPQPYTCPANSGLVYLTAIGGNAGAGVNPAISEAAVLGPCSSLTAATRISINEVTTVAAAFALAPFATVKANAGVTIGTSATNLQGLANAGGAAANLANYVNGAARSTADLTGIIPPTAEVNTLANILSACVNQGTSGQAPNTCSSLFAAASPSGSPVPNDTFQAAVNIAQHPALNTGTLFNLATASPPFQPSLSSAPADFSLALAFNGGAIIPGNGTLSVAIDSAGNAWFTTGSGSTTTHSLTEISPSGSYLSGSAVAANSGYGFSSLNSPVGLAIDQNNFVYVANNAAGNIAKFNASGALQSTFTATSISFPNDVAIDAGGNIWVANFGSNYVTQLSPAGAETAHSPIFVNAGQVEVATGPHAVWTASYGRAGFATRVDLTTFATTTVEHGSTNSAVAIDHANNAWISNNGNGVIFEYNDAGTRISPAGGLSAGSTVPQNLAIDGLGNVFSGAVNYIPPSYQQAVGALLEYNNAGTLLSPDTGYAGSGIIPSGPEVPTGIAIDGSGNVWIAGVSSNAAPAYAVEVIGIAAPVITPHATAVTANALGTRP